jgi:hypothetical protein
MRSPNSHQVNWTGRNCGFYIIDNRLVTCHDLFKLSAHGTGITWILQNCEMQITVLPFRSRKWWSAVNDSKLGPVCSRRVTHRHTTIMILSWSISRLNELMPQRYTHTRYFYVIFWFHVVLHLACMTAVWWRAVSQPPTLLHNNRLRVFKVNVTIHSCDTTKLFI